MGQPKSNHKDQQDHQQQVAGLSRELAHCLEMILTLLTIRDLELTRTLYHLSLDPDKHKKQIEKERKRLKKQIVRNTEELTRLEKDMNQALAISGEAESEKKERKNKKEKKDKKEKKEKLKKKPQPK
jgi:hypothetical protein